MSGDHITFYRDGRFSLEMTPGANTMWDDAFPILAGSLKRLAGLTGTKPTAKTEPPAAAGTGTAVSGTEPTAKTDSPAAETKSSAGAGTGISGGAGTEAAAPHEPKRCGDIVPAAIKEHGADWINAYPFRSFEANVSPTKEDMVQIYTLRDGCMWPQKTVRERIQEIAAVYSPEKILGDLIRITPSSDDGANLRRAISSAQRKDTLRRQLKRVEELLGDGAPTMCDVYALFTSDELADMGF